jgi:hypothetical protein
MSAALFIRVIGVLSVSVLALISYRVQVSRASGRMSAQFERLLRQNTLATEACCEKLLLCIGGSKAIAEHALSEGRPESMRLALGEICQLLERVITR